MGITTVVLAVAAGCGDDGGDDNDPDATLLPPQSVDVDQPSTTDGG